MAATKGSAYYEKLLEKNPEEFVGILDNNVINSDGSGSAEEAISLQMDVLSCQQNAAKMLLDFRNDDGDTVAHTAATFHRRPEVLTRLVHLSPALLLATRDEDFEGQTPFHIVITKRNRKMARAILEHPCSQENLKKILRAEATGSKFKHTVMMGQLPLSVAALTFDKKMVNLLIKHGADINWLNREEDTVFHSLIRFASVHSDKSNEALQMIQFINKKLTHHQTSIWHTAKNKDRLTPLKLAASLGQVDIFTAILNLDKVYRYLNAHDGLFDIHLYDITEIDTITQAEWERYQTSRLGIKRKMQAQVKSWKDDDHRAALKHKAPAVLDIICCLPVWQAFKFISMDAVKELIDLKWDYYEWFFYIWAAYHLLIMIHITTFAIYKTKYINSEIYAQRDINPSERTFVDVSAGLILIYATIYSIHELVRSFYFRQVWHLKLIQHNGMYRLMLTAFSLALMVDVTWFYALPHNNYFLIISLVLGWTFMSFFLRTWKRFSFYTVMFQKVLLGDMMRLSVIILFQLVAFSIAIYTAFLNTQPVPPGFENAGLAIMTMFKLMLGLTDIEVLHDAREPWLAISLYVVFVLITYVLLINSLIAMMSRTCELISENRDRQWALQRLSVILLLETLLLPRWRYLHKDGIKAIKRYGMRRQDFRCYIEVTSIQTTYREGKTVLQRRAMIDTLGFSQGLGATIWTPFLTPPRYYDPTQTLTHAPGLQAIDEESAADEEEDGEEEEKEEDTGLSHEMKFGDNTSDDDDDDDDHDDKGVTSQGLDHNVAGGSAKSTFHRGDTMTRKNERDTEEPLGEINKAVVPTSTLKQGHHTETQPKMPMAEVPTVARASARKKRYPEELQRNAMFNHQRVRAEQTEDKATRSRQESQGKTSSVATSSYEDATDDRGVRNSDVLRRSTTPGPHAYNSKGSDEVKPESRRTVDRNDREAAPVRIDEPVLQPQHSHKRKGRASFPQGQKPHSQWQGQPQSSAKPTIHRVNVTNSSQEPRTETAVNENQPSQNNTDHERPIAVPEEPKPTFDRRVQPIDITLLDSQA